MKGIMIGAGYFAQFHWDAWSRIPDVQIAGIVDLDPNKAIRLTGRMDLAYSDDVVQLIKKCNPDFIDIITPPETHFDLLKLCSSFGLPMIIQKPLAPDFTTSLKIQELIEKNHLRVMVHENWRFQPWYQETKRIIENGLLGDIHQLYFRMRMGDGWKSDAYQDRQPYFREMPRLLIYETGIHFIDTFRFLLGEVDAVYARLSRYNPHIKGEDAGIVILHHSSGATSILDASRYNETTHDNPRFTFGLMVIDGQKGTLRLSEDGELGFQVLGEKEKKLDFHPPKIGFAGDCVFATQAHFIHCLKNKLPFQTSVNDYLKSILVQEKIYTSHRENRLVYINE